MSPEQKTIYRTRCRQLSDTIKKLKKDFRQINLTNQFRQHSKLPTTSRGIFKYLRNQNDLPDLRHGIRSLDGPPSHRDYNTPISKLPRCIPRPANT
jgi:ABC-type Zn uptake system ZnuABC Zn-binding protein ZnuA